VDSGGVKTGGLEIFVVATDGGIRMYCQPRHLTPTAVPATHQRSNDLFAVHRQHEKLSAPLDSNPDCVCVCLQ